MKKETKKDIKEWAQLLGLSAACTVAVLHVHDYSLSSLSKGKKSTVVKEHTTEKTDSIVNPRDSVIIIDKTHTR